MAFAWYTYDVFLSHAVEDKIPTANELCQYLRGKKLKVWYSGDRLDPGPDITSQVLTAIKRSRHGIFLLSPDFLKSDWTRREYHVMQAREQGTNIIFPVLMDLEHTDLAALDPNLVDRFSLNVKKKSPAEIAAIIARIIKAKKLRRRFWRSVGICFAAAALMTVGTMTRKIPATVESMAVDTTKSANALLAEPKPLKPISYSPSSELIERTIANRVKALETNIYRDRAIPSNNELAIQADKVQEFLNQFRNEKSRFRNEYDYNDGTGITRTRKNVEKSIGFDPATIAPGYEYGIKDAYARDATGTVPREVSFTLEAKERAKWRIYKPAENIIPFVITVEYTNRVRLANIYLTYPLSSSDTRYNRVHIFGLPPVEHYEFALINGKWTLTRVS